MINLFLNPGLILSQKIQFETYTNTTYKFSFDIPNYWTIKYSNEQNGFICVPVTKAEKEIYEGCFEGIVFNMFFYDLRLDAVLINDGYKKVDDAYYTSDMFNDNVRAKNIKGKNWTGIYHSNVCGINCKENGFHAAAGKCQFIYFAKGNTTIFIITNGREFESDILKRLKKSFRFD